MNSFVFLAPIACLFGIIALTSLLWSVRGSRFDGDGRKTRPVRARSKTGGSGRKH